MTTLDRLLHVASACFALVLMLTIPARAESTSDRLERLERDMRQLQQDYYASDAGAPRQGAQQQGGGNQSEFMDRLNMMEQSLRDLRGQVEESNYRQKQLMDRLNMVEQKLGIPPLSSPSDAPAAAPAPPPGQSGSAAPAGAPQPLASAAPPRSPGQPGTLGTLNVQDSQDYAEAVPAPPTDEKGQFDAAIATLYQGNRNGGIKALQAFIKAHPKSKQVPSAYYWLGEAQLADKAYRESAQAFLTVVTKYPKDTIAPKSLVKLGSALIAGGQAKEGCKQLKSIKEVFPKADKTVIEMANRERKLASCA